MTFRYGSIPAPRLQAVKVVNNSVISKDRTSGESVKQKIPAGKPVGINIWYKTKTSSCSLSCRRDLFRHDEDHGHHETDVPGPDPEPVLKQGLR